MGKSRLHRSTRLSEAERLVKRLHSFSEHRVTSVLPDEFPPFGSCILRMLRMAGRSLGPRLQFDRVAQYAICHKQASAGLILILFGQVLSTS